MKFIFHKQKPSATEAEDSSLMESFYNCGVYNKGNNLEKNNCHNNHAKIEDWFTSLHQKHNNKHRTSKQT